MFKSDETTAATALMDNPGLIHTSERLCVGWQQPNPLFAGGNDQRSSENGLLLLFYGNLQKAAGYEWQNAGRALIDKTYLRIVGQCTGLDMQGLSADELAARLDGFIRRELAPRWDLIRRSHGNAGIELTRELLDKASQVLFEAPVMHAQTGPILFYLCPHLPLLIGEHPLADQEQLNSLPVLPRPQVFTGGAQQQALIRQLIEGSDWWRRRVFSAWQSQATNKAAGE
ncbi:hypothetical protein [Pseudomonas sp. S9]|uniref:hypothetical protein n=1 Tax=Pseudomonas sp. S9 TaxID=686578 RepID=UPI000255768F|nr:hypothetical protein [Pseudomonas sp. S9]